MFFTIKWFAFSLRADPYSKNVKPIYLIHTIPKYTPRFHSRSPTTSGCPLIPAIDIYKLMSEI